MKKKLVIFSIATILMFGVFSWTAASRMSIYPFQEFSVLNKEGLDCGKGRFRMEPLSFVQEKIYVGGFEDSGNPKGFEFSLQMNQRRINIYRITNGFGIAEEREGTLQYGWTSKGFSTENLTRLCEKAHPSTKQSVAR